MTFSIFETSRSEGQPIELYEFSKGVNYWRYTSYDSDFDLVGTLYQKTYIKRDKIEISREINGNGLDIEVASDNQVANLFRLESPTLPVNVTIYRVHEGSTDTVIYWRGRALGCQWGRRVATLNCDPITVSLKRQTLRRYYMRQCPYALYEHGCLVNREAFKQEFTLLSTTGLTASLSGTPPQGDGWFDGGMVQAADRDGNVYQQMIKSQVGATLNLILPIGNLQLPALVDLYPGCDHTIDTCHNKFNNSINYGGQPAYPEKSPFEGSVI